MKEGHITYRIGVNENVRLQSLYVPGIGWCPINNELSDDYTCLAERLALYCSEEANDSGIKTMVGKSKWKTLWASYPCEDHPCERFDIYYLYSNSWNRKEFYIQYNSIRNEEGCECLPIVLDAYTTYNYFVIINGIVIYASDEIVNHIETQGFDDIRIDFSGNHLIFTPFNKKKGFEEYDRLQILLNGYKPEEVKYMGKKPYYFMEEPHWRNSNGHHLIRPNEVINVQTESKKHVYNSSIERQLEDLVSFFKPMHFIKSSQLSDYITKHKLGRKYPDLSGDLEMTDGYETWTYKDGIHPKYYSELCNRLQLDNKHSGSWPIGFTSNKELEG